MERLQHTTFDEQFVAEVLKLGIRLPRECVALAHHSHKAHTGSRGRSKVLRCVAKEEHPELRPLQLNVAQCHGLVALAGVDPLEVQRQVQARQLGLHLGGRRR